MAALRILMLGATGFIGPHFVDAATHAGHAVSVFLHDKSPEPAELSTQVERLYGDRNGTLDALRNRDWDAVFDLATYVPHWVRTLGQALHEKVGHYTFISTISVYDYPGATDENSRVTPYTDSTDPYTLTFQGAQYGSLKTLCEREAQQQFPGKTLVVRPGHLIGPHEKAGAFNYWVARMAQGGEILAAGTPFDPVQLIDARDLAEWVVRMAEGGETGTFNATGPHLPMGWGELLGAIRGIVSTPLRLNWIPIPWLRARDVAPSSALLFWPSEMGISGLNRVHIDRARTKGLTFRPLSVTARNTLDWYRQQPELTKRTAPAFLGCSLDDLMAQEQRLLEEWREERVSRSALFKGHHEAFE